MESSVPAPVRVLVVANRTATTPGLLAAVRERAARGSASFTLLVPASAHGLQRITDPEDSSPEEAQGVLEVALPQLRDVAGSDVAGMIGDPSPLAAIQDAVNTVGFDEIIISTLPHRVSHWLRLDLPSKAPGLGLPVTTVTARDEEQAAAAG